MRMRAVDVVIGRISIYRIDVPIYGKDSIHSRLWCFDLEIL